MFDATLRGWTPTPGTGIASSTGGYFNDTFDSGPDQGHCKSSRALAYWIEMARATEFWNSSSVSRQTAFQVTNELWAHQLPDGGISVNYPGCKNQLKDSGESSGLTLLAFDPRVPSWFGHDASYSAAMDIAMPEAGLVAGDKHPTRWPIVSLPLGGIESCGFLAAHADYPTVKFALKLTQPQHLG